MSHQDYGSYFYGLESEYISFFAIEYEYNYPVRDMDLGPLLQFLRPSLSSAVEGKGCHGNM